MVVASPWSYSKNFFEFAKSLIRSVSQDDFGTAFAHLDHSRTPWSRTRFVSALREREGGAVTSPDEQRRSAEPTLLHSASNDVFDVLHRLPIDERWSDTAIHLRFTRGKGDYFHVELLGFVDASRQL